MKIREHIVRKFNRKTKEYDKLVNIFEKYTVVSDEVSQYGYRSIVVQGPKQRFVLMQTAKPLQKLFPPETEGGDARVEEYPFFFVSPLGSTGRSIQGVQSFAEINGELVAYKSNGRNIVEEY